MDRNRSRSLHEIRKQLRSRGTNCDAAIAKIKQDGQYEKPFEKAIDKMGKAALLLAKNDSKDIFCGILCVLSGVAEFFPVGGPIVITMLGLSSALISAFCGSGDSLGNVVRNTINSALDKYEDANLRGQAAGIGQVFRVSSAYMAGGCNIAELDVHALTNCCQILSGVEFLGTLAEKIEVHRKSKDKNEALRTIEYVEMYAKLAILRDSIMHTLHSLILESGHNKDTASRIHSVIESDKEAGKTLLSFLTKPELCNAIFCAYLYPSTMPVTLKYIEHLGIGLNNLRLCRPDTSYKFMTSDSNIRIGMRRPWLKEAELKYFGSHTDVEFLFYFEAISEIDNVYYVRSKKSPHLYVYFGRGLANLCKASETEPGPRGHWKITKLNNGHYIMSNLEWPNYFLNGEQILREPEYFNSNPSMFSLAGRRNSPSTFKFIRK